MQNTKQAWKGCPPDALPKADILMFPKPIIVHKRPDATALW